jgi:hypothetical protein
MTFAFTKRWPFFVRAPEKKGSSVPRGVRFGADSCVDLALYGADETTAAAERSDSERFGAALVAWRMLENASERKNPPEHKRMGMRSNPFAAARLFVRMLTRAGLKADIKKTPQRQTVPCVVTVTINGKQREISMTMLRPVGPARVRRHRHRRDDSQAA